MEYKDQNARDLWYHTSDSSDVLAKLSVLGSARLLHTSLPIRAKFAIIGESHFVHLALMDNPSDIVKFTEILLCIPLDIPGGQSFRDISCHEHARTLGPYTYTTRIHRGSCKPEFIKSFRSVSANTHLLDIVFPFKDSDAILPTTTIRYTETPQGIQWETLHVYPEDHEMVHSSSSIQLPE
jgi:hypothetical protein